MRYFFFFFFSSRRRHTRCSRDWSSDVCSSDLFIRLAVNGEVKQDGSTSQFIFTPEEQIEYASSILTIETGDVFSCGTCGGVGMGTGTFLEPGDVMETEVETLGQMRNRFVAESASTP